VQTVDSHTPAIPLRKRWSFTESLSRHWGRLLLLALGLILVGWLVSNGTLARVLSGEISTALLWARFNTMTTIFLGIFIEAAAFLLLGVLMSAVIQVFVTTEMLQRWVPQNRFGAALSGSMLGMIFPVCECGSVPAARRLMHKGAPVSLGVAFLLAAPAINPVVIASTWVAFSGDPWIVGGRIGLTILIAMSIAIIFSLHPVPRSFLRQVPVQAAPSCCGPDAPRRATVGEKFRSVASHSTTEFFEMGQYVVLGALIAAMVQTVVPQDVLLAIGSNPVSSVLVMMALAVILSICSTVDAFVALGFASTFNTGAILAFLVFGPMIDIKAVLLFLTTFKRRGVALIVVLATLMSLVASIWINLNVG
jgi:uncharacterized protein